MGVRNRTGVLARAFGRGYFPHQFSWLIDNPVRRLLLSPEKFADRLPLTAVSWVLEVGPGSGYFSRELARRVRRGRLVLFDLQPEMLAKARRKLEGSGVQNVGYAVGDTSARIPFPEHTFDVVILVSVLGETVDPDACLNQVFRILRRGGVLALHEQIPDPDRISVGAVRRLAEGRGFRWRERFGPSWNYTALFERPN